jgi:hypothetical protein
MDQLTQVAHTIALTMGVAWASGINLYAAILVLGLLGAGGHMVLPDNLAILSSPPVIFSAGFMYLVEFFADKVPGIDSGWDAMHTFIRVPAGAVLAAAAVGEVSPAVSLAAAIVGGSISAGAHATKAGSRVLINSSPEPFTNWVASVSEDLLVIGGLFAALYYPWLFIGLCVLFILLVMWFFPKLWRGLKRLLSFIAGLFRGRAKVDCRVKRQSSAAPPRLEGSSPERLKES